MRSSISQSAAVLPNRPISPLPGYEVAARCETCSASWRTGVCEANEVDIHYLRTGGDLPPLIALHGLLGSGACLSPLARTLKDSFDVVLPDARGHGKSSAPSKGYLYRDLAGDVVALIEKLSLNAPVLLGHSTGGMTAALVASQLGSVLSGVALIGIRGGGHLTSPGR